MASRVLCSLVGVVGMLVVLSGTAAATIISSGSADFCTQYDNATTQKFGWFTDLRRGPGINADTDACVLNITGSVGSTEDMWITLLHFPLNPGTDPLFSCVRIRAEVLIKRFDNRKGLGIVTNVDPVTKKGLFLGLYDNGNSDALTLSTFNGSTGKLTSTLADVPLHSKIRENVWYTLTLDACVTGPNISVQATVEGDNVSEDLDFFGALPTGILPAGQIGIAGFAKNSFVDSTVKSFSWGPSGG